MLSPPDPDLIASPVEAAILVPLAAIALLSPPLLIALIGIGVLEASFPDNITGISLFLTGVSAVFIVY